MPSCLQNSRTPQDLRTAHDPRTPQDPRAPQVGVPPDDRRTGDARELVLIYDDLSYRDSALGGLLSHLNFRAIHLREPTPCLPWSDARPIAAVVGTAVRDPFGLCASLPAALPKILLCADPSFETRRAATRANVDAVVKSPVDVTELSDWLEQFSEKRNASPVSVLLVDDHALTAEIYATILRGAGMHVRVMKAPADAIMAIDDAVPDLILMDMHMPGTDGIELARMIRQSKGHDLIPILFLSGEQDENRRMAARRCGGDDFIPKTVAPERLVSIVEMRAERSRALRSLVQRDSLTGLLNHARFKERAARELSRGLRDGCGASLAMIDIDHFKQVNDRFGHPVGDKVLRTLARVLTGRLRATDIVGRYGGEEFAVLLPDTPGIRARTAIDDIRKAFFDIVFEEAAGRFSASFSAGLVGGAGHDVNDLIAAADAALYRAKTRGRNRVELVRPAFETR